MKSTKARIQWQARTACAAALAVALTGCTGDLLKSDAPAPDTFRLGVASTTVTTVAPANALPLAIVVAVPRAASAIDTDRIAVNAAGNRFDYYTSARWAESAPQMVQEHIVSTLSASGQFGGGVFAAPARVPAELLLDVELRRFEVVTAGADPASTSAAPTVHVQVQASLVDSRRGTRIASFVSKAAVPASENRLSAVVAAFERANGQVVLDIGARVQAAAAALPVK